MRNSTLSTLFRRFHFRVELAALTLEFGGRVYTLRLVYTIVVVLNLYAIFLMQVKNALISCLIHALIS